MAHQDHACATSAPRYLAMLKAYEDKRFDDHSGVDPLALARAALQFASARPHRLRRLDAHHAGGAPAGAAAPRGIGTKLFQMMRAVQLEERYSKDEILSLYLTLAPFGGNLEGVRAASLSYFGKEPSRSICREAALLVALPQSPVKQRPDRHAIRAAQGPRQGAGAAWSTRASSPHGDARVAMTRRRAVRAPGDAADGAASRRPPGAHATPARASSPRSTRRCRARSSGWRRRSAPISTTAPTLAIVVVENRTRNVLAYVGGTDYWGTAGQIDLAHRARSPGSALKPFIYGLAFDDLILHPASA